MPRQVIIRPVVSEKSYALMAEGKYTFRVHDRAHKLQIASAVEEIFGVKVRAVRTSKVKSKPKRRGLHSRALALLEEGRSPARTRRADRAVRGRGGGGLSMPNRKTRPTSPGRRFGTYPMREELTGDRADQEPHQGQDVLRWPQLRRAASPPAIAAAAPSAATGGSTSSAPRTGSPPGWPRSSTTPTARRASRCSTTPTARSATSSRPQGLRVGAEVVSGEGADIAPGNSLSLARIPTGTVVHNVELIPGQGGRSAAPRAPRSRWSRRRARWSACGCPPRRCGWSAASAARPSARSRTPSTRT